MATLRERWNRLWTRSPAVDVVEAKTLAADTQRAVPAPILAAQADGQLDRLPKGDQFAPVEPGVVSVELPAIPVGDWSNPAAVQAALNALSVGQSQAASRLAKALLTDARIYGPLAIRCKGIVGLPKDFQPSDPTSEKAKQVAAICQKHFDEWFPVTEQERFLRSLIVLGSSLAQIIWVPLQPGATWQTPEINCWDAANSVEFWYWDPTNRNFGRWIIQTKSGTVEPVPGNGEWIFGTLAAKSPWTDALINPLGQLFVVRLNTLYKWAKYNDRIASPFFVLGNPTAQDTASVARITRQVEAGNTVLVVPIGKDGNQWTANWAAVNTATGSASFQAARGVYAADCAIAILGQNLSTEVKGGSHAAAKVHDDVKQVIIDGDAKSLAGIFREQILKPFCVSNFGDADLAPYIVFETKSEQNVGEFARAAAAIGQCIAAVAKIPEAIQNIDFDAMWLKIGMPLKVKPGQPTGQ